MPRPLLNRQRSYNLTESAYVTYRTDAFNVTLGGNYSLTRYDNNAYESAVDQTMRYNAYLTGEYRWRSFSFKTDFRLQGFSGYDTPELDRLVPLWNVSAEYKFLRNKAVLKAGFNDLLNRDVIFKQDVPTTGQEMEVERYRKGTNFEVGISYNL